MNISCNSLQSCNPIFCRVWDHVVLLDQENTWEFVPVDQHLGFMDPSTTHTNQPALRQDEKSAVTRETLLIWYFCVGKTICAL